MKYHCLDVIKLYINSVLSEFRTPVNSEMSVPVNSEMSVPEYFLGFTYLHVVNNHCHDVLEV